MSQPIWNTPSGSSIGTYPYGMSMAFPLSATPVSPATSITYNLLAGTLPTNLVLNSTTGVISGIPTLVNSSTTTTFSVRATDNLGNIRDATFSITITGISVPQFTTPSGSLLSTQDSIWTQLQIEYSNPNTDNPVVVAVQGGALPPGLEISTTGLIQGYPQPPIKIYGDNSTAIGIANDAVKVKRSKAFDKTFHYTRDKVRTKDIESIKIDTKDNASDFFTKFLSPSEHKRQASKLVKFKPNRLSKK
jgi:hypothetical protein